MDDQEFNLRFREYKAANGVMALEHHTGPGGDVIGYCANSDAVTVMQIDSREMCEVNTTEFKKSYVWMPYDEMPFYMTTDAAQLANMNAVHQRIVRAQLYCLDHQN